MADDISSVTYGLNCMKENLVALKNLELAAKFKKKIIYYDLMCVKICFEKFSEIIP